MIGKLTGTVDETGEDWAIVDVAGVGYEVHCPARTLAALPEAGGTVTLHIETHVREDMIRLYGFASAAERQWFRLLQSVQGVGAKVALAVLGTLAPDELASAVALGDTNQIARAHGVGPRVAKRIAGELKDKAGAPGLAAELTAGAGGASEGGSSADAVSALMNLGYGRADAAAAVAGALKVAGQSGSVEELIRLGLRELAR